MKSKTRKTEFMTYFIVILFMFLNAIRLFNSTLWADECFTYDLIRKSWGEVINGTINDFHPPLYYLITKLICIPFGYSIAGYRLSSLIAVGILAFWGYHQLNKLFGRLVGFTFVACVLMAPTMYYSVEMRMYSWAYCFITLFVIYAYQFIYEEDVKNGIWIVLLGVFAAYSHYFALIMVATIYFSILLLLLVRKKWDRVKKLLICIIISIIFYMPWMTIVIHQMDAYGKTGITIKSVSYYLKSLFGFFCIFSGTLRTMADISFIEIVLTVVCGGVLFGAIACYLIHVVRNKKETFVFYVLFIISLFFSFIAGILMDMMSHTFVSRYLYPLAGFIWILFALSISWMIQKYKKPGITIAGLVLVLFLIDYGITVYNEVEDDRRNRETVEYINKNVDENDLIVTDYSLYSWIVLDYYFPDLENKKYDEKQFKTYEKYEDIWFVHAEQIDSRSVLKMHDWEEQLDSSLGENDFVLYKLKQ